MIANAIPINRRSSSLALSAARAPAGGQKKAQGGKAAGLARSVREAGRRRSASPLSPSPAAACLHHQRSARRSLYADVKAHAVGDTIAIQIVESTTIAQSGNIATERDFAHSSGITAVGGQSPSFLNPLLAANSSTKLTGTGATASQSSLNTVLTALVVAVLPNGLLVVEARRQVMANQQHENVVLRGVVRPADIASNNSVYSYQLFDLQLDVKGKGVISDSVRQPNIVMRTLLKMIGF